jgi:oxygen-independent coproporphyrinogen-3 oxidase
MAGIYIHIPFCGYACSYCDFYFTTHLHFKAKFLETLFLEIDNRKNFLNGKTVSTIYFGGGTPSKLSPKEIESIINKLKQSFSIEKDAELTLECNPDDIDLQTAIKLREVGINRLSMGIQTFHDKELDLLGRKHTGSVAIKAVKNIRKAGFENFSLDLIYGIPDSTISSWEQNLDTLISLKPNHISSYCLTIEPGTPLAYQINKNRLNLPNEHIIIEQFETLIKTLSSHGYEHYEISNFALPGLESKHNTSYWQGTHYLGLGPSAHSFDGKNRIINVPNTKDYCAHIGTKQGIQIEELSENDRFNEYIMTGLRTKWGIDLEFVQTTFPTCYYKQLVLDLDIPIKNGLVKMTSSSVFLSATGKLFADKIASDLFAVN